jgi:hypothetical protein
MAYHESFWVAVSAVAPVIALANTVAMTDLSGMWLQANVKGRARQSRIVYGIALSLALLTFLNQGLAVLWALLSLLKERDWPNSSMTGSVVFYVVSGLFALLAIVAYNVWLRYLLREEKRLGD